MGLTFFFSGLGFKISLVPFHFWTADTYQGAPTPVTGYLSVISKGAAAITLCIILTKVFQPMVEYWDYMLYIVIVLSITVANLFAIRQSELKRFMAFSSISQAGYIMLAVVGNSQLGMASLTYYVLVYIVANMSVFTVINVVERNNGGRTDMAAYNGFYQTNPKLSFLMTLALFSLAGIPPFAGMFSKFFVFMAGVQNGDPWAYFVVFIALVNTVVSLYYYLLIVKAMYITKTDEPLPTFQSDINTLSVLQASPSSALSAVSTSGLPQQVCRFSPSSIVESRWQKSHRGSFFCDIFSDRESSLSQYRFPVATTQINFRKKTWNVPKIVLPLHRLSEQTRLLSDNKKRI